MLMIYTAVGMKSSEVFHKLPIFFTEVFKVYKSINYEIMAKNIKY